MFPFIKEKLASIAGEENLEFLRHTRNYMSASAVRNVLLAASAPLLTQFLKPDEYGILSVFSSLVALLGIIFSLGLRGGIVRYYLEDRDDFDEALGSNLIFIVGFNISSLAVVFLFSDSLAAFFAIDNEVFLFASLTAVFGVSVEIYLTYLQGSKNSKKYSALSILRTTAVLGGAIVLIVMLREKRYLGKIYSDLICTGLLAVFAYVSLMKLSKLSFHFKYIKYTLRFSIPLIPHSLSRFVLGYFDRIIIKQLSTAANTGLYSFAYDVGMVMDMVVMAANQAWHPIFFEEYRKKNYDKISRMVHAYSGYIYFAAVVFILFAEDAIRLLANARFHEAIRLVPIIVLGYVFVFLYTLFFQYASFRRKTELISLSTFIAGFANVGLNYWLIPIYGYQAAAYTTLASYALLFALHYINARFILKENVVALRMLIPNFLIVAAVGGAYIYFSTVMASYWVFLGFRALVLIGAFRYFIIKIAKN